MFDEPVKLINFVVVLPSQAPAGEDTLDNPASNTQEPSAERDIEGPAATALLKSSFGKTTGITCINVTRRTRGRKEETIFFIPFCCMAASPDKSLEGAFTYYLGSN
jgi:hypothetical protein